MDKETILYPLLSGFISDTITDGYIYLLDDSTDDTSSDIASSKAESASSMSSVVEEYQEILGKATLLHEDLFNMDADHEIEAYRRQDLKSDGLSLDIGDASFLQTYFTERNSKVAELSEAVREAQRLYLECIIQQHVVAPPDIPTYTIETHGASGGLPYRVMQEATLTGDEMTISSAEKLAEAPGVQERV